MVDAVLALEEPYRTTMIQRYLYELPPAEIAAKLGVPLETVHTRLRRGLKRLRARLGSALLLLFLPTASARALPIGAAVMSAKLKTGIAALIALAIALLFSLTLERRAPASPRADRPRTQQTAEQPGAEQEAPDVPAGTWETLDRDLDLHGIVVDRAGYCPHASCRMWKGCAPLCARSLRIEIRRERGVYLNEPRHLDLSRTPRTTFCLRNRAAPIASSARHDSRTSVLCPAAGGSTHVLDEVLPRPDVHDPADRRSVGGSRA